MKVYEIIIGNHLDDSTYSKLVLSEEPITKDNINIDHIVGLGNDAYYFVIQVQIPKPITNPHTEKENEQMEYIKNKYF